MLSSSFETGLSVCFRVCFCIGVCVVFTCLTDCMLLFSPASLFVCTLVHLCLVVRICSFVCVCLKVCMYYIARLCLSVVAFALQLIFHI